MTPRVMTVVTLLFAFNSFAQATRTWVSGVGDDANPCSRTAPCKTYAGAISKTAAGGEINALDSGGFGGVTITKAITINATGVVAGVLVAGTNGIIVNAGANDVVVLRGLDLQGINGGTATAGLCGVRFFAGKAVHIEDTLISGFGTGGVCFMPTTPTGAERLFMKNVTITESRNTSTTTPGPTAPGITISAGEAVVERTRISNGDIGISVSGPGKLTLVNSSVTGNATDGVVTAGTASVSIERTTIASNATGVNAATGTTVRVSDSILSFNTTGLVGPVSSFGNNRLNAGNGTNGTPSATLSQQ